MRVVVEGALADEARASLARAAAERVFEAEDGDEPDYVEPDDEATADIAVRHLRELFGRLPGKMRTALASARASGELISRDPFQGISEVLQNADDLGAKSLEVQLRPGELLFAHDGAPVTLSHALALATPWLSTKANEATATGRFGIGLTALRSLGDALDVYCDPYRIRIGSPTIDVADPVAPPPAIGGQGWTLLRVPLTVTSLTLDELDSWLKRWDDSALLFLRSVARVSVHDQSGRTVRTLELRAGSIERVPEGAVSGAPITRRELIALDGRRWSVYSADPPVPKGAHRAHKATMGTTPIAVGLQFGNPDPGHVHVGLPLVPFDSPCRLNAQFDPLTNRNDLASTAWNRSLFPVVAELWTEALLDFFQVDPQSAWQSIPIPTGGSDRSETDLAADTPTAELLRFLVESARGALSDRLTLAGDDGDARALSSYAVESMPLEGVINPHDVADLADREAALPLSVRDTGGRWREVLRDWRDAGAAVPSEVSVQDALTLLSDESRTPDSIIHLTNVALSEGWEDVLDDLNCIVIEGGSHVRPPQSGDPLGLAERRIPLAEELGLVRVLHSAYRAESPHASAVLKWLHTREAIVDEGSPLSILERLAALGRSSRDPVKLTDQQLQLLRDVFERLPADSREALGTDVGRGVSLAVFEYAGRKGVQRSFASPADAYLPAAIDREPDSFAVAAAETPKLLWLDNRYRDALRSTQGRQGLGAQRFLRLLGAETAPRLKPHPALLRRYQSDLRRRLARALGPTGAPERANALLQLSASYTLEDRTSDDLLGVIRHIARERGTNKRRRRAGALLSTLGRAWDRLSDFAEVEAAADSRGWVHQGQVRAFWLWRAAAVPWLDAANGRRSRPAELRVRTDATMAIYGRESSGYLHPSLDGSNRRGPLGALGVNGEPTTEELVNRLRDLRDAAEPSSQLDRGAVRTEAAIVYQALAFRLDTAAVAVDMSRAQLRRAFSQGDGLVLTSRGWRKPVNVRRGVPFLGEYAEFVPAVAETERLWIALDIRRPGIADCVEALRKISRHEDGADEDDESIALETLRFLVAETEQKNLTDRERRALRSLPLRTSRGWLRGRPVYGVDNPQLAEALGQLIPVWHPSGDFAQFRALVGLLRVTVLNTMAFEVVGARAAIADEEQTQVARLAMEHLRADLERNAPVVARAAQVDWGELQHLVVKEMPNLALRSTDRQIGRAGTLVVSSWIDQSSRTIYVWDLSALPRADAGGRAVASLFSQHHRQVAQAWRVAYDAAEDGRRADRLRTAEDRARAEAEMTEADIRERTRAFQARVEPKTRGGGSSRRVAVLKTPPSPAKRESPPRNLVDPNTLRLANESVQTPKTEDDPSTRGQAASGTGATRKGWRVSILRNPNLGGAPPNSKAQPRDYTEQDKEFLGLGLVRWLLSSDESCIVDIRGQHGVGADAVDDLERFYELKVSAGEEPNSISLTESELQRALATPDYFLVVVSGLEGKDAKPRVRVLVDPLRQLGAAFSGSVALTGVRDAGGLVYEFETDEEG